VNMFTHLDERVEDTYCVEALKRANHSHWRISHSRFLPPPLLRMETDSVSETLCSFGVPDMDKVQQPNILECYTIVA
jgi:hypothetical protein